MEEYSIYRDIAARTGGDIYIGVVGPVRTGKSTFIKRFMEALVIPNITEGYGRDRARDEMPQSAAGKTVMTTEPKFIPDEAVNITVDECANLRVRMIDCVGYIVPEALGTIENGQPRMVRTPWQEEPMPFIQAAEMGTHKVITEHSTIGMLVTTDGTIGDIPRESYVEAEERVVRELRQIGKPFAVILNSAKPGSEAAVTLAYELESKYKAPVALVSCIDLDAEDIRHILELVLHEFPVSEIRVSMPAWTNALDDTHKIKQSVMNSVKDCAGIVTKAGDVKDAFKGLSDNEYIKTAAVKNLDLGTGRAQIGIELNDGLYYDVMSELTGFEIKDESGLIELMKQLSVVKKEYDKVSEALEAANTSGYGIVMPSISDLHLEEPEIVKQNGSYGVRLRASAQSIHMIRANIETEISPIVGTEQQSEDLVRYMLNEFEEDPVKIWESNMFGKTLYELVNEGLHTKLEHMPDESREKLSETLERIINEGSNGLICIIL
ncbi:MAG: stage IV sporulation protein A [Clostridia bacterium]|nr:stage IV sporulation protein A [Clostridia bacterium]MDY3785457.1 stage IV sporulation protein A [Eubacteriales bacterium]